MRRHSGAAHSPVFSGAAHSPMLSGAARSPVFSGAARSPVCVGARLGRAQVPAARGLRLLWRPERHRAEPCFPRGGRRCGRQGQGRCSALCAAPRLLWSSCGARLRLRSLQAGTLFGMPRASWQEALTSVRIQATWAGRWMTQRQRRAACRAGTHQQAAARGLSAMRMMCVAECQAAAPPRHNNACPAPSVKRQLRTCSYTHAVACIEF